MTIRVYVDWNDQDESGRVWLHLPGSAEDLEPVRGELKEGMPLVLYWDEEDPDLVHEMDGILERDGPTGTWMARPVQGTIRHRPKP